MGYTHNQNNKDNNSIKVSDFYAKQEQNLLNKEDMIKYEKEWKNNYSQIKIPKNVKNVQFLNNYLEGQMKGDDDNPAILHNYQKISIN